MLSISTVKCLHISFIFLRITTFLVQALTNVPVVLIIILAFNKSSSIKHVTWISLSKVHRLPMINPNPKKYSSAQCVRKHLPAKTVLRDTRRWFIRMKSDTNANYAHLPQNTVHTLQLISESTKEPSIVAPLMVVNTGRPREPFSKLIFVPTMVTSVSSVKLVGKVLWKRDN